MGNFNKLAVIEQIETSCAFVPTSVYLGGRRANLVWRNQLGPVEIVQSGYEDESKTVLVIVLADGNRYRCKAETFGGNEFPFNLVDAISSVTGSGQKVELCVAVGTLPNSRAATGFFCGLRIAGTKADRGLISL